LRPDTVDQLFNASTARKLRLKAIPGWPYLDKVQLCELREQHVRDLTEAAFAQGCSAQTVTHIRNAPGVAHDAMLSELRMQLNSDLVSSAQ
jgi:hypothetical protein